MPCHVSFSDWEFCLRSSVQHPACAGLSDVLKTWRDKGGGKGEDKSAGLAELNIAVVKKVAIPEP